MGRRPGAGSRKGILIAGGGMAGCMVALAMARLRPDVPLLIVEEKASFGGERFHPLFADELDSAGRKLAGAIAGWSWPGFYSVFPSQSRNFRAPMGGFDGAALHDAMLTTLRPDQYRLGARIVALRDDSLELEGGERIQAEGVMDARGAANLSLLDLLFETRVERVIRTQRPHGLDRALWMDATIDQSAGLAFIQAFPLEEDRLRISKVLVSERAQPDLAAEGRLDAYVSRRGWSAAEVEAGRIDSLPLPMGGDFSAFWRIGGARVAKLGMRGGFIQPATGRTAPDAIRNALLVASQSEFSGRALHDLFEERARQAWRQNEVQRDYVRALAAAPVSGRRALAGRLYGLERAALLDFLVGKTGLVGRRKVQKALRA